MCIFACKIQLSCHFQSTIQIVKAYDNWWPNNVFKFHYHRRKIFQELPTPGCQLAKQTKYLVVIHHWFISAFFLAYIPRFEIQKCIYSISVVDIELTDTVYLKFSARNCFSFLDQKLCIKRIGKKISKDAHMLMPIK